MKTTKKTTEKAKPEFDFRTITSFEDACKKESVDPADLPDVSRLPVAIGKDLVARCKLIIIFQAINNGWIARGGDWSQPKWYAYLSVLPSGSGFDFSDSNYYCTSTYTNAGLRLCTETRDQIKYITEQFLELFEDMLLNKI